MADPRIVRKTSTVDVHALQAAGRPAVRAYEQMKAFLTKKLGPDAATMFAEPVMAQEHGGIGDKISWYSAQRGDMVSFAELEGSARAAAEAQLADRLAKIGKYYRDPEVGPLLRQATMVPGESDIYYIDGEVVLTNWGFVPAAVGDDPDAQQRHFQATLGRYQTAERPKHGIPSTGRRRGAAGIATGAAVAGGAAAAGMGAGAAQAAQPGQPGGAAPLGAFPPPPPPPVERRPWHRQPWFWAFSAAVILLIGVAAWLAFREFAGNGAEQVADNTPPGQTGGADGSNGNDGNGGALADADEGDETDLTTEEVEELVAVQQAINEQLEDQIARLRDALDEDVCSIADPLGPPVTTTPVVPPEGAAGPVHSGTLVDLLEAAAALVITTPRGTGFEMGTAFWVAPDLLATNSHVVASARPNEIFVASQALGHLAQATVVARTETNEPGTPDFALLRVQGANVATTLSFTTSVEKLDSVVSAGFPALIVLNDQNMNLLLGGDLSAMPDLAITSGEVSVMQTLRGGLPVVAHTAVISSGNSGGPLVDRCGRVVGINTFINVDANEVGHVSYAIASNALTSYLGAQDVAVNISTQRCDPTRVADAAEDEGEGDDAESDGDGGDDE